MRKLISALAAVAVAALAVASVAWAETTPAVVTGGATGIGNTSATLNATVNPGGGTATYEFVYGTTSAYGEVSKAGHIGTGTKAVAVHVKLTGLTPGTVYHYQVRASNKLGSGVGRDRTFTTTGHPPPGAITGVPYGVGKTTVTLTGGVVTNGETTTAYFQWGTMVPYSYQTTSTSVSTATPSAPVTYTLTGLSPGTTFHYRLVATHPGGFSQTGADQEFTTIPLVRWGTKVTAVTTPTRARHRPYLFTTAGAIVPRAAVPPGVGCGGFVGVSYFAGRRPVAHRNVAVQPNCTFGVQVAFRHLIKRKTTRLRVIVHFGGNGYLRPASARTRRVTLG